MITIIANSFLNPQLKELLKIGQHLAKLWTNNIVGLFWLTVYMHFNVSLSMLSCTDCSVIQYKWNAPQLLPFVEQLTIKKILGIYISATFSAAAQTCWAVILSVANQRITFLHSSRVKACRVMLYTLYIIYCHCTVYYHLCSAIYCGTVVKRRQSPYR